MKSIEQLEQAYQREVNLAERHKKTAADIRKQIDQQQGKIVMQKLNSLNMTGAEYDKFFKLLSSGKKTVLQAAEQALGAKEKGGAAVSEEAT